MREERWWASHGMDMVFPSFDRGRLLRHHNCHTLLDGLLKPGVQAAIPHEVLGWGDVFDYSLHSCHLLELGMLLMEEGAISPFPLSLASNLTGCLCGRWGGSRPLVPVCTGGSYLNLHCCLEQLNHQQTTPSQHFAMGCQWSQIWLFMCLVKP